MTSTLRPGSGISLFVKDSHSPGSIGSWPVKTGNENILQGTKKCHIIFSTPKGVLFPDAGGLVSRIERRDAACAGRGRDSSGGGCHERK